MFPLSVTHKVAATYIVIAKLVNGMVDSAVGAATYLLHDGVLVDGMMRLAVDIVARILGSRIQCFLRHGHVPVSFWLFFFFLGRWTTWEKAKSAL